MTKKQKKNRDYTPKKAEGPTPVILKPFEVTIEQAGGSVSRLIKKFNKKVRKAEILKPYYGRLMYHIPKSQKRREKLRKTKYEEKKRRESLDL